MNAAPRHIVFVVYIIYLLKSSSAINVIRKFYKAQNKPALSSCRTAL